MPFTGSIAKAYGAKRNLNRKPGKPVGPQRPPSKPGVPSLNRDPKAPGVRAGAPVRKGPGGMKKPTPGGFGKAKPGLKTRV